MWAMFFRNARICPEDKRGGSFTSCFGPSSRKLQKEIYTGQHDYVLPALQFTNAGLYSVIVGSAYGSATNATYQLVVNPAEVSIAMRPSLTINGAVGYNYTIQGTFGWPTPTPGSP